MSGIFARDPLAHPEALIRRVYAYVAYRLGDGAVAEDVTGEVFERAVRYRESYDPTKGEPIGWLLGIAQRCIAASVAARVAEQPLSEPLEGPAPTDLEERSVRRLTVAAAVAQLGERDQELIALRFGADLTAAQIASVLGLRTNAVEVALHRALERMRSLLDPPEGRDEAPSKPESRAQLDLEAL